MAKNKYRTDAIYAEGDMDWLLGRAAYDYLYFHSPDGTGKVYHENLEQAKEATGLSDVVYLDEEEI